MMKNKHILIFFAALTVLSSCDFLDEFDPNKVTAGNYYASEADVESTLNGVYASLDQDYVIKNNHYFTDIRGGATIVANAGQNSGIPYQFYNYTVTEENTYVYNRYSQLYKVIANANNLFLHLDDVTYADPATRDTFEAEGRFLRALAFFYLVTEWGDVPLPLEALTSTDKVNAANVRKPKAEVYAAICNDLKFVTESPLADVQSAADCGRASKAAAWALWGKVLLQQACDEDFAAQKNALLSDAITKLETAWGMRTFGELSSIKFNQIWDLNTQKSCPENIFQVNYLQGNADLGSDWNWYYGPQESGITSKRNGEGQNSATKEVFDSYEPGDVRQNYLYAYTYSGKTNYYTLKYADLDCGTDGYGGNNWIVLRYGDVVLMLAEANYWSGREDNAKTWLNMVRKRAGLGEWSGSDLRQAIYDERLHELIQEGHRWQDMQRMYTNDEMIAHFSALNSNFSAQDLLLPIPYNERIQNPDGLKQNPGY